jgi:hypothetical protein
MALSYTMNPEHGTAPHSSSLISLAFGQSASQGTHALIPDDFFALYEYLMLFPSRPSRMF